MQDSLPASLLFHDHLVAAMMASGAGESQSGVAVLHLDTGEGFASDRLDSQIDGSAAVLDGSCARFLLTGANLRDTARRIAAMPGVIGAGLAVMPSPCSWPEDLLDGAARAAWESKIKAAPLIEATVLGRAFDCRDFHMPYFSSFRLLYQPQVDLGTGAVCGAEALVRLDRDLDRHSAPEAFLLAAEHSGNLRPFSEWMLSQVCGQAHHWQSVEMTPLQLSVNMSLSHFAEPGMARDLIGIVRDAGADPNLLELELTEKTVPSCLELVIDQLKELRDFGMKLALDDFGTGYASIGLLKALPLDRVKIDRSFLVGIDRDAGAREEFGRIVAFGRSLGLEVVAEGVERPGQAQALKTLNCDRGQGFLWGPPLSPEQFAQSVAAA